MNDRAPPEGCPGAEPGACLLCTAPDPQGRRDAEQAYLCGFVDGVRAMATHTRQLLCDAHERQLHALLARFDLKLVRSPPGGVH